MVFAPPNKIVLISWVDHPLQLPTEEFEALREYGIVWEDINWQLKRIFGSKWRQRNGELFHFYE